MKTVSDKGKDRVVGEKALGEVGGINEQLRGDVLEGSAEEDEDVVAKNCLCQWSARGASFSGIVVNQEGDKDGTVAIGLLQDGRHHIQILKLTPPSSSSSAWSLNQVFTLSNITMDMYPVSLIGSYLCVANARDRTEIINWKKDRRGVLKGDDGLANGGLQYNKCSQVLLIPETSTILVIRARSINLFKWPKFYPVDDLSFSAPQSMHTNDLHLGLGSLLATSAPTSADAHTSMDSSSAGPSPPNSTSITSAPQPPTQPRSTVPLTIPRPEIEQSIASYSFGWVDCITATIAHAPPSSNPSIKAVPKPIYIFFRGTLDDPWANDDTKLEMWVIEGNPDWDSSFAGVEERDDDKNEDVSVIPLSARDARRHSVSSGDHGPANPPILNISSSPTTQTSNLGQSTVPYLFPPTPLPSLSIPTPRGPLLCPTLILGPSMTAVWIEPKERMGRVAGMVVDYPGLSAVPGPMNLASTSNMHGNVNVALGGGTRAFGVNDDIGPRRTRGSKYGSSGPRDEAVDRWREQQRRKREKMVVVAFPGPFYGGDERTSSSSASTSTSTYPSLDTNLGLPSASASTTTSAPKPLQLIYNSSPSNWSAIDYDEDRGRVAVASSVRGFVVVDL
ncbi:hypothetical protein BJ165DRAFT_864123 [Panaeolus papilionaceus]|nr:hypothetical protein BJ165DRAFT_864123 [Panaeolus papilionaceus]